MSAGRFVLLLSVCLTASRAQAAPSYTITDLGAIGGIGRIATIGWRLNNSGQVVGAAFNGVNQHAYLYSGGTLTDLGTLGGSDSYAFGINASGTVVGNAKLADGNEHASSYSGGVMTDLGTLGGATSNAYAINNSGTIVGYSQIASGALRAISYNNGQMTDLGTLGGYSSYATDINHAGQIVGNLYAGPSSRPFLYSGGVMTDLGTLGGTVAEAWAINESGKIVGHANTANNSAYHAVAYQNGAFTDLGTLGGLYSEAHGVNSAGSVVGGAENSAGHYRAFVDNGGGMYDLNGMIDVLSGWSALVEAYDINDQGQITGTGYVTNGQIHAFLLTPVPEPGSVVLASAALAALTAVGWRRARAAPGNSHRQFG